MARASNAGATRARLSRDRVLRAALALADDGGLEALSMRKLAQELGVEAMSLYNHVANKDDLIAGILELVAGEIELPPEGVDWKTALRRSAISYHQVLARHRWASSVWMSRREPSAVGLRHADALLRALREGGLSAELTYHAYHALVSHVMGFTLYQQNFQFDAEELKEMAARFLRKFPADDYPDLAEHIRQHIEPSGEHGGTFEFGLDLILDGLERLRDAA